MREKLIADLESLTVVLQIANESEAYDVETLLKPKSGVESKLSRIYANGRLKLLGASTLSSSTEQLHVGRDVERNILINNLRHVIETHKS